MKLWKHALAHKHNLMYICTMVARIRARCRNTPLRQACWFIRFFCDFTQTHVDIESLLSHRDNLLKVSLPILSSRCRELTGGVSQRE